MSEGDNALSIDSAVDEIMQILGDDDDGWSPPEPGLADGIDNLGDIVGQGASDDGDAADPDAEAEAAWPIQPPASWKADAKERFKDLRHELQQTIADRERERKSHFSKTQRDVAQVRKALETGHRIAHVIRSSLHA